MRPLGLPSWSDKLVGEVMRLLLEAYFEPRFSDRSHGFRPRKGCHTALREVADTWKGTTWFIEGDIAQCFDTLDHEVMIEALGEKIHDNRFLRLVRHMLAAGYLEDWVWNATLSGVPQGGVISPILSNIYLHRLDTFVETVLIPEYTRGERRKRHPGYLRVQHAIETARRRGDRAAVRELRRQQRSLPSQDPADPDYRRLRYVRYADDHLLGFTGPKTEAEQIKNRLAAFLREDLALELSEEKTLVTHARTGAARFLGYEITIQHADHYIHGGRRRVNGAVLLRVPRDVIKAKCAPYLQHGKPELRSALVNDDDLSIVSRYGSEYRGLVNYYLLARDVWCLTRLRWVMETSLLKTLACKHGSTVSKMAARYKAKVSTPHGLRTCFQATVERPGKTALTARFGGLPLRQQKRAVLNDRAPAPGTFPRKELIRRLLAGRCEMCQQIGPVQVHQIAKLAHLTIPGRPQPAWAATMAGRKRKTLVVCQPCHNAIHTRQATAIPRRSHRRAG